MSKIIQVRNVPDALHRKLKARAASEGLSLSRFLLQELAQIAERPGIRELKQRLAARSRVKYGISPVAILREERSHQG